MATIWEMMAMIFRTLSSKNQQSKGIYLVFQIFILLAPLCKFSQLGPNANFTLTLTRGKCIRIHDLWPHGPLFPSIPSNSPYTRFHYRRHLRLSRHCFVRDPTYRGHHGESEFSTRRSTKGPTHLHVRNWPPRTLHRSIRRLMRHFPSSII